MVVNARRAGGPPREEEIIEVIEGELRVQYRVRWSDGHESLFAPGAGALRIEPARDAEKTSSVGTEPKKLPAKASTAKEVDGQDGQEVARQEVSGEEGRRQEGRVARANRQPVNQIDPKAMRVTVGFRSCGSPQAA
jgi:hypothetical protein